MRILGIVLLGLLVGCASEDGPVILTPEKMRIIKVAGDGQREPVAANKASVQVAAQVRQTNSAPLEEMFEERLWVRVGPGEIAGKSLMGSGAVIPPGTQLYWRVREEGCGKPFGAQTATNDSAYSVNRWVKGTKAGLCHMDVCRILSDTGDIACDDTFVVEQLPGEPTTLGGSAYFVVAGEPIDLREPTNGFRPQDQYQNAIPADSVIARYTPEWRILGPTLSYGGPCDTAPVYSQGTGWLTSAAPEHHPNGYCLEIFIKGRSVSLSVFWPLPSSS